MSKHEIVQPFVTEPKPFEGTILGEVHELLIALADVLYEYGLSLGAFMLIILLVFFWVSCASRQSAILRGLNRNAQIMTKASEYIRELDSMLRRVFQEGAVPATEMNVERLREEVRKMQSEGIPGAGNGGAGEILTQVAQRLDEHLAQSAQRMEQTGERIVAAGAEGMNRIETRLENVSELVKTVNRKDGGGDPAINDSVHSVGHSVGELRDKVEQQAVYLHDEFAALAAKLERLSDIASQPSASLQPSQSPQPSQFAGGGERASSSAEDGRLMESLVRSIRQLGEDMDGKLSRLNDKLERGMDAKWSDALGSVSSLRERIEQLAIEGREVRESANFPAMMGAHQEAENADGRRKLSEILPQILAPDRFSLDAELSADNVADALVRFPDPRDSIAIDGGFQPPIVAGAKDEEEARQDFAKTLAKRIGYVADNLIAPPLTGQNALLFVPSEAAFAEVHAHHRDAVKDAQSRGVWLTSPSTLPAVVNTVNAAVRDHHARRKLQELREMAAQIVEEARLFENRLTEIGDHVNSAWRSVQRAESAGGRLLGGIRDISRISQQPGTEGGASAANESGRS